MSKKSLVVDKELNNSLTFFCEGLQIKAEPNDLLERFSHYFDMYCSHFELEVSTWYDLRIAIRDAQVYLIMQLQFVQLINTPYDYMQYIDCLNNIVLVFQRCAQEKMKTKI